ncbi:type I glyceraldehyde-3-phosphate dehydrogenase [Streptomyces lunaelactis]|uniref:Type I glyceraldehyde-3-phosphate dehydrogenase n=1 Tax=Streptomyces lunaelactis TaxID=1535768 RepID=A0A2R4SWY3_9ACTN|nr:type I glyceraldehyde-3-phosphate dehydrogenase [Streptomyces lunaelactis]AVZ71393.1 type I glyceraldehyde-3-phosphate dehydrogenase [Streptomyces lunaelactis]NUK83629.1 type I glyceraldehyde-3-phosphate dehydrogenase [Streptomyces lunaelactis]
MTVRVGINGFGRIGRNYLRSVLARAGRGAAEVEVVAVNDIAPAAALAHLLEYDSTYGPLGRAVGHDEHSITVDGQRIAFTAQRDPAVLAWGKLGVEILIESTGHFRTRDDAALHLKAGARKVLISSPGKDVDATVVMGVNQAGYDPDRHHIVSGASCTTNCVVPMVHVLHEQFGIVKGLMTTIHGYTNDQALLDSPHKDLRRARSAAVSIIPTSTGAARAVGLVIPALDGALDGIAVRVPVPDGSLTDLTLVLRQEVTTEEINTAFTEAAEGPLHGILRVNTAPIVSRDIIGDPASCIIDAPLTQAHGDLVKVFGWYDNEWGYSNRLLDLTEYVAARL